jgi:hypothetical protein
VANSHRYLSHVTSGATLRHPAFRATSLLPFLLDLLFAFLVSTDSWSPISRLQDASSNDDTYASGFAGGRIHACLGRSAAGRESEACYEDKAEGYAFFSPLQSYHYWTLGLSCDLAVVIGYLAVPDDQASVRTGSGIEADAEDVEARKVVNRVRPSLSHPISHHTNL